MSASLIRKLRRFLCKANSVCKVLQQKKTCTTLGVKDIRCSEKKIPQEYLKLIINYNLALTLTQDVFVTDSQAPDTLHVVLQTSSFISWHRLSVQPRGTFTTLPQFNLLRTSRYSMLKLLCAPFIYFFFCCRETEVSCTLEDATF